MSTLCTKCSTLNLETAVRCVECGELFLRHCEACGQAFEPGAKFCTRCNKQFDIEERAARIPPLLPDPAQGERRYLVLLFSDIVDSSRIAQGLDAEDWREVLASYYSAAHRAISAYGGVVAKHVGDGIVAYFGWPNAHDNDAQRSIRAARDLIAALADANRQAQASGRPEIHIRLGVHFGEVVIASNGEVYGDATNIAARAQLEAVPDSIVVTKEVRRLIRDSFSVADLGSRTLRGIDGAFDLYRVEGMITRDSDTAAPADIQVLPFVDRYDAFEVLEEKWALARSGKGQVVVVSGEPGIGKTRLLSEFRAMLNNSQQDHLWLQSDCDEFSRGTPFYPVTVFLNAIVRNKADGTRLDRLAGYLKQAGLESDEALFHLSDILRIQLPASLQELSWPISPDTRRRRLLNILVGWILNLSTQRAMVIAIEDVHWSDPSTLEFLQALAGTAAGSRLMIVATTRPATHSPFSDHAGVMVTLSPLSNADVREIIARATKFGALTPPTVNAIVDRTGGVPLFAQELASFVSSHQEGVGERQIPSTLSALLNARLDRLGPARELLQLLSVLGRSFPFALASALADIGDAKLKEVLQQLIDADVLAGRTADSETTYHFRHALIHDAAYESLLRSRRRELHGKVAQLMSERFPELCAAQPELHARHLASAGLFEKAASAWDAIGAAATERGAHAEAQSAYQQALSNLAAVPASAARDLQELKLSNAIAFVLQVTRGYSAEETIRAAEHSKSLARRIGSGAELLRQTSAQWAALSSAGKFGAASVVADQFADLAALDGAPDRLAFAGMIQLTSRYRRGDLTGAERSFTAAIPYFSESGFRSFAGSLPQTFGNASRLLWMLGRIDDARQLDHEAIEFAEAANSKYDLAFAQYMSAILMVLLREPAQARHRAELSIELSDQHGFPQFAAISRVVLGRALSELGAAASGVPLMKEGIGGMNRTGSRVAMTMYLSWLAEAQAMGEAFGEALETIDQAAEFNPEEQFFAPEMLRIRGELRAATNRVDLAESDLKEAIAVAEQMSARTFQLRALTSLHRFQLRQGDAGCGDEIEAVLKQIQQGLDTADVIDARALLAARGSY